MWFNFKMYKHSPQKITCFLAARRSPVRHMMWNCSNLPAHTLLLQQQKITQTQILHHELGQALILTTLANPCFPAALQPFITPLKRRGDGSIWIERKKTDPERERRYWSAPTDQLGNTSQPVWVKNAEEGRSFTAAPHYRLGSDWTPRSSAAMMLCDVVQVLDSDRWLWCSLTHAYLTVIVQRNWTSALIPLASSRMSQRRAINWYLSSENVHTLGHMEFILELTNQPKTIAMLAMTPNQCVAQSTLLCDIYHQYSDTKYQNYITTYTTRNQ